MLLSTDFQSTIVDHDIASVEGDLVTRIIVVRGEDKGATVHLDESQFRRILNVDEEAESVWHGNTLAVNGRKQVAPRRILRPKSTVSVSLALEGKITCSYHRDLEFGIFIPLSDPFGSRALKLR